jgi:hypothetical protein
MSSSSSSSSCGGMAKSTNGTVSAMINGISHDDDDHDARGQHGTEGGEGHSNLAL